jgi:hypothetical protein
MVSRAPRPISQSEVHVRISIWLCVSMLLAGFVVACGGKRQTITVPPRLDMSQYGRAALVTFTVENAKGSLHELATRRFAERVLHASRGVEIVEVGNADGVLQRVGERAFGAASAKAIGDTHDVPVVFAGHVKVSNVKPSGGLLGIPYVEATVSVDLNVGLYSTRTGGTLWRSGAASSEKVGQLSIIGGEPSFSATDPNAAYGRLVDHLVAVVSRDLYPTYERR